MPKVHVNLSIDYDIVELAKNLHINMSNEFNEWLKLRVNKDESQRIENKEFQIAKLKSELNNLQSLAEIEKRMAIDKNEELKIIDYVIMVALKNSEGEAIEKIAKTRSQNVITLFRKKLNKFISEMEAEKLLLDRLKERLNNA